ncbi:MAG: hypothetical protein QXW41_07480 [Fervidicoccaceae archaeon]
MEGLRAAILRAVRSAGRRYVVVACPAVLKVILRFKHAYLEVGEREE